MFFNNLQYLNNYNVLIFMDNINLLRKFFKSFMNGDIESMLECYHDEVIFYDQVFGELEGEEVKTMWRMLFQYSRGNLQVSYKDLNADDFSGSGKWRAVYHFGQKRRKVINLIESKFKFKDNKIIEHRDHFDLWKWSSQALGWKGWLFGWSYYFQLKIQKKSREKLMTFRPIKHDKLI